jgi:hypothetical protein
MTIVDLILRIFAHAAVVDGDPGPNKYSAIIQLIQTVGGIVTALGMPVVLYLLSRNARQGTRIESQTNGNLSEAQAKVTALKAKLTEHGIPHDG